MALVSYSQKWPNGFKLRISSQRLRRTLAGLAALCGGSCCFPVWAFPFTRHGTFCPRPVTTISPATLFRCDYTSPVAWAHFSPVHGSSRKTCVPALSICTGGWDGFTWQRWPWVRLPVLPWQQFPRKEWPLTLDLEPWLCCGFSVACMLTAWRGKRDIPAHRDWMIRNFALSIAAVTLRIYLPLLLLLLHWSFRQTYITVSWLCWVPNLLVAEWLVRRRFCSAKPGQNSMIVVG